MDDHTVFLVFLLSTLAAYSFFFTMEITGFAVAERMNVELVAPDRIGRYSPGEIVPLEIRLTSNLEQYPADAILFYSIQDKSNHDLSYREDTFAIAGRKTSFTRLIRIPPEAEAGQYFAYAEVRWAHDEAVREHAILPIYVQTGYAPPLSLSVPIALLFMIGIILILKRRK